MVGGAVVRGDQRGCAGRAWWRGREMSQTGPPCLLLKRVLQLAHAGGFTRDLGLEGLRVRLPPPCRKGRAEGPVKRLFLVLAHALLATIGQEAIRAPTVSWTVRTAAARSDSSCLHVEITCSERTGPL